MPSFHSLNVILRDRLVWREQRVDTFLWLLCGLIDQGTVRLWRLASSMPTRAKPSSTLRRLERFFASRTICAKWRAQLCWDLMGRPKCCDLIFDRTQWRIGKKDVNILVLAVSTSRFTLPLFWMFFDHRGTCSAHDCAKLLDQFIGLFGKLCIREVLADREFGHGPMVDMLLKHDVNFTIRVKSDNYVLTNEGRTYKLASLCRNKRHSMRSKKQFRLKQQTHRGSIFIACSFKHVKADRVAARTNSKPDQMILITTNRPKKAVERYRKRWKIETMFADLKSRGFNLENSRMTEPKKLDVLLSLVAIAYVWVCATVGRKHIKVQIKGHGFPAKSWLRTALEQARKLIRYDPEVMVKILKPAIDKSKRVG